MRLIRFVQDYEKGIDGGTEAVAASDVTPTATTSFEELALRRRDERAPQAQGQLDGLVNCGGDDDDGEDADKRAKALHDSLHRMREGGVEALGVQTRGQETNAPYDDQHPQDEARDADSSTKGFYDVLRRVEELEEEGNEDEVHREPVLNHYVSHHAESGQRETVAPNPCIACGAEEQQEE